MKKHFSQLLPCSGTVAGAQQRKGIGFAFLKSIRKDREQASRREAIHGRLTSLRFKADKMDNALHMWQIQWPRNISAEICYIHERPSTYLGRKWFGLCNVLDVVALFIPVPHKYFVWVIVLIGGAPPAKLGELGGFCPHLPMASGMLQGATEEVVHGLDLIWEQSPAVSSPDLNHS